VCDLAVPDGVPVGVPLGLAVAEDEVDLAPARGQVELEAGALVVVAVEADADHVDGVVLEVVAAAGIAMDLGRIVPGPDRHVDVVFVVEDLQVRRGGWGRSLRRGLLRVVSRPLPLPPRLVVQPAVDHRRLPLQAHRRVHARRILAAEGVGGLVFQPRGGRRDRQRAHGRDDTCGARDGEAEATPAIRPRA
jgi:hypothetical protein